MYDQTTTNKKVLYNNLNKVKVMRKGSSNIKLLNSFEKQNASNNITVNKVGM